ncbi:MULTISPECIES: helix-turn-helix domain-containing protein [Chryseobacterium]|uniref:AraC-like DNA-binding protein n=1 Tax=Chryseobacterium camelliae TaxID=1265445 RepID=A0ABU0THJ9_9FLAO|nr:MULTISPECIES: helix-turn-helix domain-containing protein [Chryseobacterium]MDT3409611.1 AraC-like DNA-binding protein [Pseudacidovorax intermedius]MDQ1096529.1 AraC-like DNA-binding protein [Chryseobacterium camelliae]MDQ1100470.1 AraC-like DNA-binding protein [Chryseobacterium sp. SORGH_AS_1048]MDR6087810.1 AraC-like DNA-binding protein [Chryseobacterium sp. SORGH_AS_0909]MDR6132185.1 AraC-like DNA-binding protein [Chryseobacterium sp. SORGH_AS_1175]
MQENDGEYKSNRIEVPEEFSEVFSHFYHAENASSETISRILLPSFQTILIFSFGLQPTTIHTFNDTQVDIDSCLVLGPVKKAFQYSLPPGSTILVANFKNDAFFRFFGQGAIWEHFSVHPDQLLDENCFTALWKELNNLNDTHQRINYILEYCRPYLRPRNTVAEALSNFDHEALDTVKSIASLQNQTERTVQLSHKKYLGYTSKEASRYRRFLKAVMHIQDVLEASGNVEWFDIVSECGYYDQSQLIHDFNYYLHISPTQYLKFQEDICISENR